MLQERPSTTASRKGDGWSAPVHRTMAEADIRFIATVPDGGLTELLERCRMDASMRVVTLTSEEEGIGLLCGAWLGGERGVLLMQSSGVGNCVNMLSVPAVCGIPCVMLITMRGEQGEPNPWQVPMGRAVPDVLSAMGVMLFRPESAEAVADALQEAADEAFRAARTAAVLVSQGIIGFKDFGRQRGR